MGDRLRAVSAALLLSLLAAVPAAAAAADDLHERIAAALPKLDALAAANVGSDGVPGMAIAVVYRDEVVYLKGFGVREAGKPDVVDPDTVYQLASCSKPIAATVVAALVSDGAVGWDAKIADIDPGFRLHDAYPTAEVTIRDLFAHRSGLPGDAGNDLEQLGFSRDVILQRMHLLEPAGSFRAVYRYSNFGLTEGAVAAAHAAHLTWEDAADQRLFRPLGMTSTSARYADFLARTDRAALHVRVDGQWRPLVTRDPDPQSPAGGISSSARDMTRWVRLELGNGTFEGRELIKPAALEETHRPAILSGQNPINGRPSFYGAGWTIDYGPHGVMWGHAGAFSQGARTLVQIFPEQQIGIVVLTNVFPSGVPEGIASSFIDTVFDGAPSRDWVATWNAAYASMFEPAAKAAIARYGTPPASASPALPPQAYAGRYANDYLGTVSVVQADGGLVLHLGPDGKTAHRLRHFDRDTFTVFATPESPEVPSAVTFTMDGGKAGTLTLEDLNAMGQGVLHRVGD